MNHGPRSTVREPVGLSQGAGCGVACVTKRKGPHWAGLIVGVVVLGLTDTVDRCGLV